MPVVPSLILATDLDGTFLEGNAQVKQAIYSELLSLREQVTLIYVTGRGIESVKVLCLGGYLPKPHFIIGDHGTCLASGEDFNPIECLQTPIVTLWNNANQTIRKLLAKEPGIELQPLNPQPPYRVAYYYDPPLLRPTTLQKINDAGFDVILSCGMYLDILPRGVNKGSSLLQLMKYLQVETKPAIVCGDSLNDLSLFQTGIKSIVVGNAEKDLLVETKKLPNVYHSPFPGVLGILDGLHFYGKHKLFQNIADLFPNQTFATNL